MKIFYCIHEASPVLQVRPAYTVDGVMQGMADFACGEHIPTAYAYQAVANKMINELGYRIESVELK